MNDVARVAVTEEAADLPRRLQARGKPLRVPRIVVRAQVEDDDLVLWLDRPGEDVR